MATGMNKSQLAKELGERSGQSPKTINAILDGLAQIVYREAVNGFILPGICKLSVIQRKERRFRHPSTGQLYQIAARPTLAITALKKCRVMTVPAPEALLTPITETALETPVTATLPATGTAHAPTSSNPADRPREDATEDAANIVFPCPHCGNTVSALGETANMVGECPFCGGEIQIPASSPALQDFAPPPPYSAVGTNATGITGFVTFVCHTCNQEIEAPVSMVGIAAACPSCGSSVYVPTEDEIKLPDKPQTPGAEVHSAPKPDLRSMTIRIDLSDIT